MLSSSGNTNSIVCCPNPEARGSISRLDFTAQTGDVLLQAEKPLCRGATDELQGSPGIA